MAAEPRKTTLDCDCGRGLFRVRRANFHGGVSDERRANRQVPKFADPSPGIANAASVASMWRVSGIAGLLVVAASFVASAINVEPPMYNQDSIAIAAWFAENSQQYRVGHFVAGLAFLLFYVPFFAGLCERLRAAGLR